MARFWTDAYQQHFQKYFQKPFDIQVYHDPDGSALKLATHDWARQGFRVLASMGLADKLVRNDEADFGEVILFCDVPDKEVPQLFVNSLFFILQHDIPLSSRFAIGFGAMADAFTRRHGKSALYFTRPAERSIAFSELHQDQAVGKVYQAFFIAPAEDKYLDDEGPDAFEQKFWPQFGSGLTPEEQCELAVDKRRAQELQVRQAALWRESNKALSVRRTSCV